MYVIMYVHMCVCLANDVSKYLKKLKRESEGIAERDDAGRSTEGMCNLHNPIWIKKHVE